MWADDDFRGSYFGDDDDEGFDWYEQAVRRPLRRPPPRQATPEDFEVMPIDIDDLV